jgi:NAD(P)-dependent dehydrogenase (short-subunit alcohol dehydrogenase family)
MSEQTLALVTGANQGIGYEIAAGLGALGWSVGVGDRNAERQRDAVAKLRADGVDAFPVPIDVTDDASVAAAARQIEKHAGRLDVLVNNAGATGAWPQNPTTLTLDSARAAVPALRVLAGQARWDVQDSSDLFRVVLDELGIELPDADRAQSRLARRTAGEIVAGHIRAACGADELWLVHQKVRDSGDLRIFVVHRRKSGELGEPGRRRLVLPRSD